MPEIIPKAALDYIKNKKLKFGFSYKDVWHEEHAVAFTVAKAMQYDVLSDLHNAVIQAVEKGQSFETFKKNIKSTLQKKGWWGRKDEIDPETEKPVNVQLGSDRRLKTIYKTNMRQSYMDAQYNRIMESDLHPYIRYCIGPSEHHRPEHLQWEGLVLPKDDPWWGLHRPQREYGCNCYIRAVTERQMKKYKEEGIPDPIRADGSGGRTIKIQTEAPPEKYTMFYNERKKTFEKVPEGVNPAFNWDRSKVNREEILKKMFEESKRKHDEITKNNIPHLAGKQKISDTQKIHTDYIKNLSANSIDKLGAYSSGNGAKINRDIYKLGKNWEKSIYAPVIKTLDGIIGNAPLLTAETFFFKGDSSAFWKTAKVGDIKILDGFFSTAILKNVAERYATEKLNIGINPIMVVVRAPIGTKGLYIGEKTEYHKGNEFEYLFPRGTKFRILEKDVHHVLVEAINDR